ncbi:MAG: WYL domain-containing protein [Oscillospiraceae bacterium]|nr:WYL domain-containing protein [Oscillospiraceae bacterium]
MVCIFNIEPIKEAYDDGIKMWLLSQGPWVKVISPEDFRDEVKYRLRKALEQYEV